MTKSIKILFTVLLVIIGLLAITSGYFLAKDLSLDQNKSTASSSDTKTEDTPTDKTSDATKPAATTTPPAPATTTTAAGDRPSSPTDTYTVVKDDTLFIIGQKVGMSWTQITGANGIAEADADKIKIGQILVIPKNNQVSFTVNSTKAQELQKQVDAGQKAFRLSAVETAKSDASSAYGIVDTDTFKENQVDNTSGAATIIATHGDKNYEIKLIQPATRGEKGIWAIESIKLGK